LKPDVMGSVVSIATSRMCGLLDKTTEEFLEI